MTLVPELYVSDLARSLRFYVDLLGFGVDYQRPEEGFAAVSLEGGRLMLEAFTSRAPASDAEFEQGRWRTGELEYPLGRGVNFEFTVADIGPAHARHEQAGYPVKLDRHRKRYRVGDELFLVEQFLVLDPDGYLIRLAQGLGTEPL